MTIQSLSGEEAGERSSLIAVDRYAIAMDLTGLPTGPDVRCVATVSFTCREPGAATFVDCAAEVVSATLNGVPLPAGTPEDGRIALPDLAGHNVLVVETVQSDTAAGPGVHKAVDPADGEVYLWTTFEPDEAHFVWACFDQPDLKAPHAFTVTAPAAWTVTSNSGDPAVEDVAGGARRWTFPDTPPLSAYNTVVNAGPFHEVRRELGGYDLGVFARRSLAAVMDRDAEEVFTLTAQGLEFFGRVFGMPFPQRKYDQVFMPEFGGAMENYGCVTWSDSVLRRSGPTPAEREDFAKILLHELAHMWFGNIVTMRWWDDLWLNEAFAEFACNWAAVRATSYQDVWAGHLATGKLRGYSADQGPISHPIRLPVPTTADAASIFDAITYEKGASALHQLMIYVGEENFSRGMAAYFARHAWGNTTLQDLADELAAASGRDIDAWCRAWLDQAGPDSLALEREGEGFVLVADGPGGPGSAPRPQVLAVGAYRSGAHGSEGHGSGADGSGAAAPSLEQVALVEIDVAQVRTPVSLPADADLYLVNDNDLTFAVQRLDAEGRGALVHGAAGLPSSISRGVAVATIWDQLLKGEITAEDTVRCVTSVLAVETGDSVIEPYLQLAVDAAELWAPESRSAELAALVAATCRALAADPGRRQVALRALARCAADLDDVAWLQAASGDDVDLQWRALTRKAELGAEVTEDIQRLLLADPDPDAWLRALTVRAATPSAAEKEHVWQKVAIENAVPIGVVGSVMAAFWRPGHAELVAPYAERYLALLPALDRGGMIPAMVYTNRLFPLYAIEEEYVDAALAAAGDAAAVVRKCLTERSDLVRRMLRARDLK